MTEPAINAPRFDAAPRPATHHTPGERAAWLVILIPLAAVTLRFVSDSDALRGLGVTLACALAAVALWFTRPRDTPLRLPHKAPHLWMLALAGVITAYGLIMGLIAGNDGYYLAAGAYHWAVELMAIALLASVAAHRLGPAGTLRLVAVLGLALALVSLAGVIGAHLGLVEHGGHFVGRQDRLWRLEAGMAFPLVLMLYVIAALSLGDAPRPWRPLLLVATLLLAIVLLVTLKRAMWLSLIVGLLVLWLPAPRARWLAVWASLLAAAAVTYVIIDASRVFAVVDFLTYNPDYRVVDTIADRSQQLADVWAYVVAQPFGHGFGAEFFTYVPGRDARVDVHYIHSIYVTYLLQLGLPATVLAVQLWYAFSMRVVRSIGRHAPWDWVLRATLASLIVIALNGIILNATHTVWAGLTIGLGAAAITASRRTTTPSPASSETQPHAPR